jgi:hypothetical protein
MIDQSNGLVTSTKDSVSTVSRTLARRIRHTLPEVDAHEHKRLRTEIRYIPLRVHLSIADLGIPIVCDATDLFG